VKNFVAKRLSEGIKIAVHIVKLVKIIR